MVLAGCLLAASCGGEPQEVEAGPGAASTPTTVALTSTVGDLQDQRTPTVNDLADKPASYGVWNKLPDAPIPGRAGAVLANVGSEVIVFGGDSAVCPAGADCDILTPPHTSGAAFDLDAGTWRSIADAPVSMAWVGSVVVGSQVYALSNCSDGPRCPDGPAMLRYDVPTDAWDVLAAPPRGFYTLTAVGNRVVAYRGSDDAGDGADYRFDEVANQWLPIPDDPMPAMFDRFVVDLGGQLFLFGSVIGGDAKAVASFDFETSTWTERATGPRGFQAWRVGTVVYLNAHFSPEGGGIYDPASDEWSSLPPGPSDPSWRGDAAGVLAGEDSVFSYASGWILEVVGDEPRWRYIGDRPDTLALRRGEGAVVTAVSTSSGADGMFVFGGFDFGDDGEQVPASGWTWTN